VIPAVVGLALLVPGLAACAPKQPEPVVVAAPPPPDPEAWRATQPPPAPEKAWSAPVAKSFTLSNGISVYLVEQGDLPLVSVQLVFGVGREANPAGKAGLLSLTASMLDEGTRTRDGATLASDAAKLGADLTIAAGDEAVVVSLDALTGETLGPSLDLLADVVLNPAFDKKVFARVQGDVVAALQAGKSEPNEVARRVFAAQLWGADHPYGTPSQGSEASVKALKLADVTKAYAANLHAGNAAFVIAGRLDEASAKAALDARFGKWTAPKGWKAGRAAVTPPAPPLKTRVVFQEQPGAVQSVLRVGTIAPARTSPDYWKDQVAVNLFGGMFGSRLNMALREEKGWSYGAYAGIGDGRDYGVFQARTSVQADKTAESVQVVFDELKAQASRTPGAAELKLAQDSMVKSLPGNFETNGSTAGAFIQVPRFGLPVDLWRSYGANVAGVDAAAVADASRTLLDAGKVLVVVVGPRTVEVDDGQGGKRTVDVVAGLQALGQEFVEVK
jgi:zinc protease